MVYGGNLWPGELTGASWLLLLRLLVVLSSITYIFLLDQAVHRCRPAVFAGASGPGPGTSGVISNLFVQATDGILVCSIFYLIGRSTIQSVDRDLIIFYHLLSFYILWQASHCGDLTNSSSVYISFSLGSDLIRYILYISFTFATCISLIGQPILRLVDE